MFKDLSDVLSRGFKNKLEIGRMRPNHKHDRSDSIIIENDNVTLTTKLISKPDIRFLRFDKKSFSILCLIFCLIGFIKIMRANTIVKKTRSLIIIDKSHIKCDCIDGSV